MGYSSSWKAGDQPSQIKDGDSTEYRSDKHVPVVALTQQRGTVRIPARGDSWPDCLQPFTKRVVDEGSDLEVVPANTLRALDDARGTSEQDQNLRPFLLWSWKHEERSNESTPMCSLTCAASKSEQHLFWYTLVQPRDGGTMKCNATPPCVSYMIPEHTDEQLVNNDSILHSVVLYFNH